MAPAKFKHQILQSGATTRPRSPGSIEVTVYMSSINFGMPSWDAHGEISASVFDAANIRRDLQQRQFTKFTFRPLNAGAP